MASQFERLKGELEALPIESRASLVDVLSESLDETIDEDAGPLWLDDIGRDAQFRAGTATPKPVDQVMREARAVLGWKSFRERDK